MIFMKPSVNNWKPKKLKEWLECLNMVNESAQRVFQPNV